MEPTWARWARRGLWLLPAYGALTLLGTITHQPDPSTDFAAWSGYVVTGRFYLSHLVASIVGLSLGTLGVISLGLLLSSTRRPRAAGSGVVLHVLGAGPVLAMFGVAAFVQPAMGRAFLDGQAGARGWYEAVFNAPATLVPAILGLVAFAAASIVLGWAAAAHPRVPLWAAISYGASGPLIGFLGLAVGALQTVGSVALVASGLAIALRMAGSHIEAGAQRAGRSPEQPLGNT